MRLSPEALKAGYDRAYRGFYSWRNISAGSLSHDSAKHRLKHFAYAAGWKKFEPLWDLVIKARGLRAMTPMLEAVLSRVSQKTGQQANTQLRQAPPLESLPTS